MVLSMIEHDAYLVIDAGGTYLKSAVLNNEGSIMEGSASMVKSFSGGSKEEILMTFSITISRGLSFIENAGMILKGIGLAFPGPFDFSKGIPLMKHKFQNIYGVNLRKAFYEIPGILPHIPVRFIHDGNAVLIGEIWKGNAQGFANVAVITLGTGLGFAFSIDKMVQCNDLGSPAITIYKFPFQDGILEDFTAQRGFLRVYNEISSRVDKKKIQVSDIGKGADEGDMDCILTFLEVSRILAINLEKTLQEKNIQCLLFGGQISHSFHHMEEALRQGLNNVKCLRKISVVKNINNAAFIGVLRTICNLE